MARTVTSKDYYHWYKDHGICVNCCTEKAVKGETHCLMCKMDRRERQKEYYSSLSIEDKRKRNLSSNAKKNWCRENRICYYCYKRPVAEGKKMCGICLAKNRERAKKDRIRHGAIPREMHNENDVCYFCGNPADVGYRTCSDCRERCVKNLPTTRNNENHLWRKYIKADIMRIEYNIRQR